MVESRCINLQRLRLRHSNGFSFENGQQPLKFLTIAQSDI